MDSRIMKLREERVKPKVPYVELQNSAIQMIVTTRDTPLETLPP